MAVFLFKQSDWLIASKTLRPPLHLVSWPRCWPQCWSALGDSLMHWQPIVQSLSSDWFSELLRERLAEVCMRDRKSVDQLVPFHRKLGITRTFAFYHHHKSTPVV